MRRLVRPQPFYNREAELSALSRGWRIQAGGLAMVFGRRRLGKTYLLQRFFSDAESEGESPGLCCYYLADQATSEVQRLSLAEQLVQTFPTAGVAPAEIAVSWNSLLRFAASQAVAASSDHRRVALVLDEFPYLVAQNPELASTIQAWWDREGVHVPILVVLCGSQLSTMAALGVESAPLYGRFNAGLIRVEPMRFDDVAEFYRDRPGYGVKEKLLMYGAFGGTPRYHAMVDADRPWRDEIVNLLMRRGAPLESEARFLMSSEQIRDPAPFNAVLRAIAQGATRHSEIQQATAIDSSALSHPLRILQELGWIWREMPFGELSERRGLYRIDDPFLLFWYRFISPLASAIQFDDPLAVFQEQVEPHLPHYMGWSIFEKVCVQWLKRHAKADLGLSIGELGRFWTKDSSIEIDIVAELHDGAKLFAECKWSPDRPVGASTYIALMAKVASLPDRSWADRARYIIFSLGGFTLELMDLAKSAPNVFLVHGSQLL